MKKLIAAMVIMAIVAMPIMATAADWGETPEEQADFLRELFGRYEADGVWITYHGESTKIPNAEIIQMGRDELIALGILLEFNQRSLPSAVLDRITEELLGGAGE